MDITLLTENTANKRGLLAEHGLSVLIEHGGRRLLFDTGQSGVYAANAEKLGVSLEGLDGIVLSHGHYDHTGGLPEFPGSLPPVYASSLAFEDKLCSNGEAEGFRRIGIPWRERKRDFPVYETREKEEILPGFFVLSRIPALLPQEPVPGLFFIEKNGTLQPDRMQDEQLLIIRMEEGLAVFAGCAHAGILNCLKHVSENFPGERIFLLLAGMHLRGCGRKRLEDTIEGLREYGISHMIPLHCTGAEAAVYLRQAFGASCHLAEAGKRFSF